MIKRLQSLADRLVFGKYFGVTLDTARQPHRDGGIGHIDVQQRLQAAWTTLVGQLADTTVEAPWKNIWYRAIRDSYAGLTGPPLLCSTCSFHLLQLSSRPSQIQKLAFRGWVALPRLQPMFQEEVEPSEKNKNNNEKKKMPLHWVHGVRADLPGARVATERIWFNPCFSGTHRAFQYSSLSSEREAIAWAREGLVELKDLMVGTCVVSASRFLREHPSLAESADLVTALTRGGVPKEWLSALADGTAPTWGDDAMGLLPSGLLDDDGDGNAPAQQDLCRLYAHTLHSREPVPGHVMRIKHAYELRLASEWSMPRTFDRDDIMGGRHNHIFSHVPAMSLNEAVGRAVKCIKNPAVPPEITETAWACAHSALPFGPSKFNICHRATCPCGCGAPETVLHTFHECKRSSRVWELTFKQWRSITGENKVVASNAAMTLLGDRSMSWLDDVEQSEYGALAEPFAVIHHCTLHAIKQERDKDAAPRAAPRKTAQQVLERAERLVRNVVEMRWAEARAAERSAGPGTTGSSPTQLFRGKWEGTGFVAVDEQDKVKLLFYMREATRAKWKRNITQGCSREQEFAPPDALPAGTVSIFTDGSAVYDKGQKAWVAAGFGLTVVRGGNGHEHSGGIERHHHYAPIKIGDEGTEKLTNNVAEVMAFIHALRWARAPENIDTPCVMRYDSKYAALITVGVYKAKKNKQLVAAAQAEWKLTYKAKPGKLWMRHVKGHSDHEWNEVADDLAKRGCGGRRYVGPPMVD